jgi:TetR/AcrR family transcriptional regulator
MDENIIIRLERDKIVTATFRKLAPEKKEQIYHAALNLFSRKTFDRVTLDELAVDSAVSKGSLFQYFTNKTNVLKFVSTLYLDNYSRFLQNHIKRERAVRATERIREYLTALAEYWSTNRIEFNFYLKLTQETSCQSSSDFTGEIRAKQVDFIRTVVERGMQTGEIRRDIDVEQISLALSLLFDGVLKYYSESLISPKRRQFLEAYIDKLISLLFDGIRA